MSFIGNKTGAVLCLIAGLVVTHVAGAQTRTGTTVSSAAAPSQQTMGADALFARWDKDANKLLSLDEFKVGWQEAQAAIALRKLHENFLAMDANKNGSLDATEYAKLELVKQSGSAAPLLSSFDTDQSRALNFKEYVGLIQFLVGRRR